MAADIGGGTFGVETITKVGYRLVHGSADAHLEKNGDAEVPRTFNRRHAVAGLGATVAGAGVLGAVWLKPWRHRPDPEAVELVRLGDLAQRASRPDQTRQAVTYFERAVRVDPKYGAAWGALALAYTHSLDGFSEAQRASLPAPNPFRCFASAGTRSGQCRRATRSCVHQTIFPQLVGVGAGAETDSRPISGALAGERQAGDSLLPSWAAGRGRRAPPRCHCPGPDDPRAVRFRCNGAVEIGADLGRRCAAQGSVRPLARQSLRLVREIRPSVVQRATSVGDRAHHGSRSEALRNE